MLISLMVLVSGCGNSKSMTFADYKSTWNSIVKENMENNRINLPESALKLPDVKSSKDNTGRLVYNIPLVNITQTKNFLVAEVDESDQIRSITLHATLSRMSEADRRDDLYQSLQLASLAIFSMKAPDGEKARKLLLGLSESGSVKEHYLMGRNRTYTDESGNEYLFNSVANDMFTLVIKTKLESKNAKKKDVPQNARETEKNGQTSLPAASVAQKPAETDSINQVIKIKKIAATSILKDSSQAYPPEQASDGDIKTCWAEGVPGYGIKECIFYQFADMYTIHGFNIWNGYQKSEDLYYKNSRPLALRVSAVGYEETHYLKDTMGMQRIDLKRPVKMREVQIFIEDVAKGSKYDDTCISEISFY